MSQLFVRPEDIRESSFRLRGDEAHHALRVLRKKEGDQISFFDGAGGRYEGVLTRAALKENIVEGRIVKKMDASEKATRLRLFQGLPRGSKFDFVIEKAVELGVDEIIPFLSAKSVIRLEPKEASPKLERWRRLAASAAKQCDRPDVPGVTAPRRLFDLEKELSQGPALVFHLDPSAQSLKGALSKVPGKGALNLVIGPESGFSSEEIEWLQKRGGILSSVGKLTLRTETAGLAILAIVNHELGLI